MIPGQPIFEFLLNLGTRYETLGAAIREPIQPAWDHLLDAISGVNRAHVAQARITEGTWFLRHMVETTRKDVSIATAKALYAALEVKTFVAKHEIHEADLDRLIDDAIIFIHSLQKNPEILSAPVPKPSHAMQTPEPHIQPA